MGSVSEACPGVFGRGEKSRLKASKETLNAQTTAGNLQQVRIDRPRSALRNHSVYFRSDTPLMTDMYTFVEPA